MVLKHWILDGSHVRLKLDCVCIILRSLLSQLLRKNSKNLDLGMTMLFYYLGRLFLLLVWISHLYILGFSDSELFFFPQIAAVTHIYISF